MLWGRAFLCPIDVRGSRMLDAVFTETGTGLAWDKDGMTPHAATVENGRNLWKTPDTNPRLN